MIILIMAYLIMAMENSNKKEENLIKAMEEKEIKKMQKI